jgi:glucokinase
MAEPQFIGVDIGGTNIRAARFRPNSHFPEHKIKTLTLASGGLDIVLERMEAAVRDAAGIHFDDIAAIGIAAPGPIDPRSGTILNAPNLSGWTDLPLQRLMEERLGRRVYLGNDANVAALGEWKFGAGRGHNDVLYLTISTGIGAGLIAGGRMLVGASGLAAEVGHMLAVPDGPMCGCGLRGHLEAVASGTAIGRETRARLEAGQGVGSLLRGMSGGDLTRVTAELVGAAAQAGDEFATQQITEAGTHIGRTVASLLHVLNPSIVVFGGGVSLLGEVILEPIRAATRANTMSVAYWRNCPMVLAALGDDAGLVGAGALAMESVRTVAQFVAGA